MNKVTNKQIEKDYLSGEISTKHMNNFPEISNYINDKLCELRKLNIKEFGEKYEKELNCINKSHIDNFTNIFGKRDFIYKGEYKLYVWHVEYEGCEALIFSGTRYGSSVEIILNNDLKEKGDVLNFLKHYIDIVNNFE